MLEVQAIKFVRSMKRQVASNPLIVTEEWSTNWLRDVYDSFEKAKSEGKPTEVYLQAEEEFLQARQEGRIIVRNDDGSGSSVG
jgi:hypothetical protein